MSKYHSICDDCGMEDTNDNPEFEDCGHPIWSIIVHEGHEDGPNWLPLLGVKVIGNEEL